MIGVHVLRVASGWVIQNDWDYDWLTLPDGVGVLWLGLLRLLMVSGVNWLGFEVLAFI